MSGLESLLNSDLGKEIIGGISGHTGAAEDKTAETLDVAMPLLMGAMKKNASTPEGAAGLMNALNSGRHDGSLLDNLGSLFSGGVNDDVMNDGAGILSHVLGTKQPGVETALSQKSGLSMGTIAQILKVAAPLVLAFLAKQKHKAKLNNPNDLSGLLGSMLGGQPAQNRDMISSLLDADGDGSVFDDISDMVAGTTKKKGGIGGLIDSLFG